MSKKMNLNPGGKVPCLQDGSSAKPTFHAMPRHQLGTMWNVYGTIYKVCMVKEDITSMCWEKET